MVLSPGTPTEIRALTPEWHELRRTRLCATDWAKVLLKEHQWSRATPFGSPLSVWEKLTGRRLPTEDDAAHLRWGQFLETSHAEWLEVDAGIKIERCGVSWVRGERFECSPDGFATDADGRALLELKAPTPFSAQWEDEVPLEYQLQAQAGMWVTGLRRAYVSSLVFPGPPRWAVLEYDEAAVERFVRALEGFWERHVVLDAMPPTTGSERDREILQSLRAAQADGEGRVVVMPADIVDLCCEIDEATSRAKVYDGKNSELRNQLRAWMLQQQATRAVDPAGAFAWSFTKRGLTRGKA